MNRYVDHLLNMSKLEAGALTVTLEAVDLNVLARDVAERLAARMGTRTIICLDDPARPAVEADPVLLEQALINLVENADVHTPAGGTITLEVFSTPTQGRIEVRDEGPGISQDLTDSIFDKFFRGGSDRGSKAQAGVGLGLAVSRGLINGMGGSLTLAAADKDRPGATFVIAMRRSQDIQSTLEAEREASQEAIYDG